MKNKVVFQAQPTVRDGRCAPMDQPFIYPDGWFSDDPGGTGAWWTCVRTRPRWEKKFAAWLQQHRRKYFLPVFQHETISGRKRRKSDLPLFPGFVFVAGDVTKKDFAQTGCVAYVLKPRGEAEARHLDIELKAIWRGLTSGMYIAPVRGLAAGERCRIVRGPLQGVEAKFERLGHGGRLVLQVEMMGGGIAVDVAMDEVEVSF